MSSDFFAKIKKVLTFDTELSIILLQIIGVGCLVIFPLNSH